MNKEDKIAERPPITGEQRLAQALAIIVASPEAALLKAEKVFEAYAFIHAQKRTPEGDAKCQQNYDLSQEMKRASIALDVEREHVNSDDAPEPTAEDIARAEQEEAALIANGGRPTEDMERSAESADNLKRFDRAFGADDSNDNEA